MAEARKIIVVWRLTAAVLFLWVVVLFIVADQTSAAVAVQHDNTKQSLVQSHSPLTSRTRKDRFFSSTVTTVQTPLSSPEELLDWNGNPDKLYEEDKRLVHTGPNPLHN